MLRQLFPGLMCSICLSVIYFILEYAQRCIQAHIVCISISLGPCFQEMGRRKLTNTSKLHFLNIHSVYACSAINTYKHLQASQDLRFPILKQKTPMKERKGRIYV